MACQNGEYDSELAAEAEKWAGKPLPFISVEPEPEPSLREKIAEALREAGIPPWAVAGLIVLIIAALLDPEPFTKVVLLVGTAAAILIFIAIGRESEVPPAVASASPETDTEGDEDSMAATGVLDDGMAGAAVAAVTAIAGDEEVADTDVAGDWSEMAEATAEEPEAEAEYLEEQTEEEEEAVA